MEQPTDKRYVVNGSKSEYFHESYDTPEQALLAASLLVEKGFGVISIRDIKADGDSW